MWGDHQVPQTNVLPKVDLVITHGGNNTTTECFHFGKPMIALPLFWDQYDNAQRVDETGFGVRLRTYEFDDAELTGAVDRLLADTALRAGWTSSAGACARPTASARRRACSRRSPPRRGDLARSARGAGHRDPLADASRVPYWLDRAHVPSPPAPRPLAEEPIDDTVDLVVVGAGFTGLWAAIEAALAGRSVVVLEAGARGHRRVGPVRRVHQRLDHPRHPARPCPLARRDGGDRRAPDRRCGTTRCAARRPRCRHRPARPASSPWPPVRTTPSPFPRPSSCSDGTASMRRCSTRSARVGGRSPTYLAGYRHATANGLCDPARLAWLLADVAERSGVRIREGCRGRGARRRGVGVDGAQRRRGGARGPGAARHQRAHAAAAASADAGDPGVRPRDRHRPAHGGAVGRDRLADGTGPAGAPGITDAGNQFHYYRPTPDGGSCSAAGTPRTTSAAGSTAPTSTQPRTHRLLANTSARRSRCCTTSRSPTRGVDRSTRPVASRHGSARRSAAGSGGRSASPASASDRRGSPRSRRSTCSPAARPTAPRCRMVQRAPIPFPPEPLRTLAVRTTKRSLITEDDTGRRTPWLRLLDRFGVGFDT
jgi:glycine/D-amino acid oxidase-like deaminating enzyme